MLALNRHLALDEGAFLGFTGQGEEYLAARDENGQPRLLRVDAATGAASEFHDPERMQSALGGLSGLDGSIAASLARRNAYTLSADGHTALFNERSDLYVYHFDSGRAVRLTRDSAAEVGEAISPDGHWVSFVRDSNLYVVSSQGGEARALTSGGSEDLLFGRLDWVYQEEVYGRGNFQANWWSPDSERLAFLALDQTAVPKVAIVDSRTRIPTLESWRYPKAGDPNPIARLGVIDVRGGKPKFFDLEGYPADCLIVAVGWTPDARQVVAQIQDRTQTWLDLVVGDPVSGKLRRLLRDTTGAWVTPLDGPHWIEGSNQFLWRSERSGFAHLYLYADDGTLLRQVTGETDGSFEVDAVHRVDARTRRVWFSSDREDVKGSQLYVADLDGGQTRALTPQPGTHSIQFSAGGGHFVDTFSSQQSPPRRVLCDSEGRVVRELCAVDVSAFDRAGLRPPSFQRVTTRDGFTLEAMLYTPPDFDPSRRYPLVCFVYGGPHAPMVLDSFQYFGSQFRQRAAWMHHALARTGCLVWVCDNRSASGKGLASAASHRGSFGPGELADIEQGLDHLIAQGFVDERRIGLWGWSFGGTMTAYALTHSSRFRVGIAGAPVTDWSLYDSIYTERYLGLPSENPAGYAASSVVGAAANLSGRLLLICGDIDENVHAQNSLWLAAALQRAGKRFDWMIYPGNRHAVTDPAQREHLFRTMYDYFVEHLDLRASEVVR